MLRGTLPPWRSSTASAAPRSERAFWLWKPVWKIALAISPSLGVGERLRVGIARGRGPGVTMLTRSSVHWAERIVATSSSHGVVKSSEQRASG